VTLVSVTLTLLLRISTNNTAGDPAGMRTYARVCSRLLTDAHVCSRMLTDADGCFVSSPTTQEAVTRTPVGVGVGGWGGRESARARARALTGDEDVCLVSTFIPVKEASKIEYLDLEALLLRLLTNSTPGGGPAHQLTAIPKRSCAENMFSAP
jgi:hypothetical protein